jgi:hypothetical protein
MSDAPPPSPPPPPYVYRPPPPQERSGCLTAIMVVSGIILLIPGLCSLIFVAGGLVKSAEDLRFVVGLGAVGCLGVALLWWAIRRRGP